MVRQDVGNYRFVVNPVLSKRRFAWKWTVHSDSSAMAVALGYALSEAEAKHAALGWITRGVSKRKFPGEDGFCAAPAKRC